jgi:hypothetical protein
MSNLELPIREKINEGGFAAAGYTHYSDYDIVRPS